MRVLVGCESSGKVREAFRARGHDAWSCDYLPAADGSAHHFQCDVREVVGRGWDLAIFHPTCTYLSVSGLHWNKRGRMVEGRPRAELTEEALEFVRWLMALPIPRTAIENPVGCISTRIRRPDQIIQPYQFGDDASKATCLWLKGLAPLVLDPARYVQPRMVCKACRGVSPYERAFGHGCVHCGAEAGMLLPRWGNQTDGGQNRLGPSEDRWRLRSETYPGIAAAFAEQWGASA